jgi:membrane protease YdiL (CAAX protease family)
MSRIESLVTKHPVSTYTAVTFGISWGGALLAIGSGGGMRGTTPASDPRFAYALVAMLAGPSVAGVLMTWLVSGRVGLRQLLIRALRWRVGVAWYAAALLIAPLVMTATLLALSLTSPAFLPGIVTSRTKASLLLVSLVVGLSAGLFEELGWTGFAIPTMRRERGVVPTGLIVGIWWSAWHLLPNIWSARAASGELAVAGYLAATVLGVFVGYLTAFRVLMVWVYNHTESVLVGMLMHVSLTASLLMLNPLDLAGAHLLTYSFTLAGALWIVVAVVALADPVRAEPAERRRPLPGDDLIPEPLGSLTHAITIARAPQTVWPWLIQMGSGRAGWYSYNAVDNGRQPSATRIVAELQHIAVGTVFPALPGVRDGFAVLAFEEPRWLTLGWPGPDGTPLVTWSFTLEARGISSTRLIVRARGGQGYRFHGLPRWLSVPLVRFVHFVMERKQLLGIARRVEASAAPMPTEGPDADR